jgi:hypothetical protein
MPTIYPDWEIYIYHDTTVPSNIIDKLTKYKYVKMINMFNSSIVNNMSWCFLVKVGYYTWKDPPTIIEYAWLVSVLQPYPTAIGHFAHEVLPGLLYNTCSIVIAVSPFVQRYIALLPPHFQGRIAKWKGATMFIILIRNT